MRTIYVDYTNLSHECADCPQLYDGEVCIKCSNFGGDNSDGRKWTCPFCKSENFTYIGSKRPETAEPICKACGNGFEWGNEVGL